MRTHLLTGQTLIDHVKKENLKCTDKSIQCLTAGYYRVTSKGSILPAFTRFYESLLDAKNGTVKEQTDYQPDWPDCVANTLPDFGCYIACLASYNAGELSGGFIDFSEVASADDIKTAIDWILSKSPVTDAEEYAVHDWYGVPGFITREEWPDWDNIIALIEAVNELEYSEDIEAYYAFCSNESSVQSIQDFRDSYRGSYESIEDWARELMEESGALTVLPQELQSHFDYSSYARDFKCNGDIWTSRSSDHGIFVFWSY